MDRPASMALLVRGDAFGQDEIQGDQALPEDGLVGQVGRSALVRAGEDRSEHRDRVGRDRLLNFLAQRAQAAAPGKRGGRRQERGPFFLHAAVSSQRGRAIRGGRHRGPTALGPLRRLRRAPRARARRWLRRPGRPRRPEVRRLRRVAGAAARRSPPLGSRETPAMAAHPRQALFASSRAIRRHRASRLAAATCIWGHRHRGSAEFVLLAGFKDVCTAARRQQRHHLRMRTGSRTGHGVKRVPVRHGPRLRGS
mmetsp:Transcript_44282/g.114503  ORF Transcript_44282/g.114503 Transcript_44282/m.114503 type:complete len:253 (+) Transcript_44282:535-1293(+)